MDPIRRLLMLSIVASVLLAEPTQARALFASKEHAPSRTPATATERFIRQLAVVLRQTVKPAIHRPASLSLLVRSIAPAPCWRDLSVPSPLLPHESDLPPPLV